MENYTYAFTSPRPAHEIYTLLLDIEQWWTGFHGETITGKSHALNDSFTFSAGGGMHVTTQKLVELEPGTKIVWLVTESNLSFLEDPKDWENTKIRFDIQQKDGQRLVRFTHQGLLPELECYDQCSTAWAQYLHQLEKNLN